MIVFVGGFFPNIGGEARRGFAALDARTGAARTWDPIPNAVVWTLAVGERVLYVGGDFRSAGNESRMNLAAFGLAAAAPSSPGTAPLISSTIAPNPIRSNAVLHFEPAWGVLVSLTVFDLEGRCVATMLQREPLTPGGHDFPLQVESWYHGIYFSRLDAGSSSTSHKMLVVK